MKTYDLGTGAAVGIFAALALFISQGQHEPSGAIFNCERVEMPSGYFNYVDPTCPAQFRDATPNDLLPGEGDEAAS